MSPNHLPWTLVWYVHVHVYFVDVCACVCTHVTGIPYCQDVLVITKLAENVCMCACV